MSGTEWLTFDQFAERVGEEFTATGTGTAGAVVLELADATESDQPGGTGPDDEVRMQFALLFTGPDGLAQATYTLAHAELGDLHVFLVPIGPGRYEAAFA